MRYLDRRADESPALACGGMKGQRLFPKIGKNSLARMVGGETYGDTVIAAAK